MDAASEAIAYESGYEGDILEPGDVPAAIRGLTGDIHQAPAAALAIASSGLSPSSSLLRDMDLNGASLAARRVANAEHSKGAATMVIPLGFYGL